VRRGAQQRWKCAGGMRDAEACASKERGASAYANIHDGACSSHSVYLMLRSAPPLCCVCPAVTTSAVPRLWKKSLLSVQHWGAEFYFKGESRSPVWFCCTRLHPNQETPTSLRNDGRRRGHVSHW
jgi:hypothetical protein